MLDTTDQATAAEELTPEQMIARDLRKLADFFEARTFPQDAKIQIGQTYIWCYTMEVFGDTVAAMGQCTKQFSKDYLDAEVTLGSVKVQATIGRQRVCRRVKVGEKVIPAQLAVPERTEAIYEWECPDSFLGLAGTKQQQEAQTA